MKKKLFAIFAVLMLVLANSTFVFADAEDDEVMTIAAPALEHVVDNAGILSAKHKSQLEDTLTQKSYELGFDIVILTENDIGDYTAEEYADDFYDYNGYGHGPDHDGCLLLIDMGNRNWQISTTGFGITALTDAGIKYISNQFLGSLSDGEYYDALSIYAEQVELFVKQAQTGEPYDVGNMPKHKKRFSFMFTIPSLIVGFLAAAFTTGGMKNKMKTVTRQAAARNYLVDNSLNLDIKDDLFITATVNRHEREEKSRSGGGGSSTHVGSSGTTHGGGGGSF